MQIALLAASLPIPVEVMHWSPSDMFPSWIEDGTNIQVPISSWAGLTADTADATTGDSRQVIVSFCSQAFAWYNSLAEKPGAITVTYSPGRFQTSGDFMNKQKAEFTITTYLDYPTGTVAAEV